MCLRLTHGVYQLRRVVAETQPKPGNLYTPGTSGRKGVYERDKMKKTKTKKKKNRRWIKTMQFHGSQWRRRSQEDLGREDPEEDALEWNTEFQRGIILERKMGTAHPKGRTDCETWAPPRMSMASLQITLSITSAPSTRLRAEQGLKRKFIKMKWPL